MTKISFYSIIQKEMKKPPPGKIMSVIAGLSSFAGLVLSFLMLNSCATRVPPREDMVPAHAVYPQRIPIETLSEMEEHGFRIKQNGAGLGKYFVLNEDGTITVKADFGDRDGDFEAVYDFENIRVLENSEYEIGFTVNKKSAGLGLSDKMIWTPAAGNEGLLLAHDDDYLEVWEQHFDLFEKYNARVTFFIQGEWDPETTGAFCEAALARGHSIGFHTINHLDLRRVSEEVFYAEAVEPVKIYWENNIPVNSFAYPFGFSEPWMHEILLEYYDVLRGYGVTYRIYNDENIRSGYIIAKAIDNTVIRGDENYRKTVLSMLRTVKFLDDQRILPLTTHDINDDAAWGITAERLEFLLKSAVDLKLKFYGYDEFNY